MDDLGGHVDVTQSLPTLTRCAGAALLQALPGVAGPGPELVVTGGLAHLGPDPILSSNCPGPAP